MSTAILDYQTLKQKYEEYTDKLETYEQLLDEYTRKAKQNKLSAIIILDDIAELQGELNALREDLFKHLVESSLFELFKKEIRIE